MQLTINGDTKSFPDAMTVAALVEHLGMKSDRVAIELNHDIVPRASWPSTELHDGDRLEIVHFVGGGKSAFSDQHSASDHFTNRMLIATGPFPQLSTWINNILY